MNLLAGLTLMGLLAGPQGERQPNVVELELKKFSGTWERIVLKHNGVTQDADTTKNCTWEQDDKGKFKLLIGGVVTQSGRQDQVDPTKSPKTIDSVVQEGQGAGTKLVGIYQFVGNTVDICWAPSPAPRPSFFTSMAGSNHTLEVWRKVK